jgi:hypothetical protein
MPEDGNLPIRIPARPWRDIAQELATETDQRRILELSIELNCALDAHFGKVRDGDGLRAQRQVPKTTDSHQARK